MLRYIYSVVTRNGLCGFGPTPEAALIDARFYPVPKGVHETYRDFDLYRYDLVYQQPTGPTDMEEITGEDGPGHGTDTIERMLSRNNYLGRVTDWQDVRTKPVIEKCTYPPLPEYSGICAPHPPVVDEEDARWEAKEAEKQKRRDALRAQDKGNGNVN